MSSNASPLPINQLPYLQRFRPKFLVQAALSGLGYWVAMRGAVVVSPVYAQAEPKRLSDWMLEQPFAPGAYNLGLSWRVASERPAQHALREALFQALARDNNRSDPATVSRDRLRNWLTTLPITGRVPVAVADPRWLQANALREDRKSTRLNSSH